MHTVETNGKAVQTGPLMARMAYQYREDVMPFINHGPVEMFNVLSRIPFREDRPGYEVLQRPWLTLMYEGYGGDCDDKAIAMASWAILNNVPFRFVAVRRAHRRQLHHVYTELYIQGKWVPFDPTFRFNLPGRTLNHYQERVVIWPSKQTRRKN